MTGETWRTRPSRSAGMTPLYWVLLWSLQPDPALLSDPEGCAVDKTSSSDGSQYSPASPLLESLQCHNDYDSRVDCEWRSDTNQSVELWLKTGDRRNLCDADEHGRGRCTFRTGVLGIGIDHTAFFLTEETRHLCSPNKQTALHLHRHLRALPPVNLSSHETGDGGRGLRWSSPYPAPSSLNRNLTYQLSYRTRRQDGWTTEIVTNTGVKLSSQLLIPGCRYEARARARASVGHWSAWSPAVTWHTGQDVERLPSLHCVLHDEKEAACSWEVRSELARVITYRLACQNAPAETCCPRPTITPLLAGTVLRYSCSLAVSDLEHQLLTLQPTHNARTFKSHQHIHPKPPGEVKVREKGRNWVVHWVKPSTSANPKLDLDYRVCYYRKQEQGSPKCEDISGSTSVTILGATLAPSADYRVKVRSLVAPRASSYRGTPSEWTEPVDWTSKEESWSYAPLMYILIAAFAATVVIILYCTIPTCQRKVVLWVESVPSPGKSKILSDIKSNGSWTLTQSEKTSVCKVQHLDSLSAGSSDALLWPTKDADRKLWGQDEGCQDCSNPPSPAEEVNGSDTSSMSFSGPYIFCQPSEPNVEPAGTQSDNKHGAVSSPSPANFTLYGEGYVRIPRHTLTASTHDLVSHANNSAEDDGQRPRAGSQSDDRSGPDEPPSEDRTTEYTSANCSPWPQGDAVQPSGYCHLPPAFMSPAQ